MMPQVPAMDSESTHLRGQRGTLDSKSDCSSVRAPNHPPGFAQNTKNRLAFGGLKRGRRRCRHARR